MRAVSIVRRTLGGIKTGHAGTLDPLADGVLVLACGKPATKSIPHFMGTDKRYRTQIDLRAFTATDDTQADPEPVAVSAPPTDAEIDALLGTYQGTIMQTPPVFSAIRVNGKRAYAEARAGRPPELEPRVRCRCTASTEWAGLGRWWNWRSTARKAFTSVHLPAKLVRSLAPGGIV